MIEEKFLKPVRDEQKRRKYMQIFKTIFADLQSFKRELKGLSKKKAFKTNEITHHYVPNTVSMETYMYALDKHAIVDQAVEDMVGAQSKLKQKVEVERINLKQREAEHDKKVEEYVSRVKQMVKETGIVQNIDDPDEME